LTLIDDNPEVGAIGSPRVGTVWRNGAMAQSLFGHERVARGVAPKPVAVVGSASTSVPFPLRPLIRLPLLSKVLATNMAIVVLGAIVGTWLTIQASRVAVGANAIGLVLVFVVVGGLLSLILNFLVLRAAFRPLTSLDRVADAVRQGDLSARAEAGVYDDPQLAHLAATFNGTLDELERDRAELRSVASQVIDAQEEERKRISRELHDDTAQVLFAQLLRLAAIKASPNEEVRAAAAALEEMTVEALEGVRRLALELRPPALDDLGLLAAMSDLAERFADQLGILVDFQARGPRGRLPSDVELVLYRVAQEALTNIAKHAAAQHVEIDLDRGAEDVTLSVRDDGRGFDPRRKTERDDSGLGLGLFGMAERVSLVGGSFTIWTRPVAGSEIYAFIPLSPAGARDDQGARVLR